MDVPAGSASPVIERVTSHGTVPVRNDDSRVLRDVRHRVVGRTNIRYPWLRGEKSNVSEAAFKTWVEPAIVGFLGLMLRQSDHANGSFLMFCAFAMCVKNLVGQHLVHEELTDMNDNLIEQQNMAERFRQSRDYDRLPRR